MAKAIGWAMAILSVWSFIMLVVIWPFLPYVVAWEMLFWGF